MSKMGDWDLPPPLPGTAFPIHAQLVQEPQIPVFQKSGSQGLPIPKEIWGLMSLWPYKC